MSTFLPSTGVSSRILQHGGICLLFPHQTNVMALAATANLKTLENVIKNLEMKHTFIISRVHNNPNFFLGVLPKPADHDTSVIVKTIVQGITENGVSADRHFVLLPYSFISLLLFKGGQVYQSQ